MTGEWAGLALGEAGATVPRVPHTAAGVWNVLQEHRISTVTTVQQVVRRDESKISPEQPFSDSSDRFEKRNDPLTSSTDVRQVIGT
jgi:hypothetical protein